MGSLPQSSRAERDNLVIETLAIENLAYAERIASLEQDVHLYRALAQEGLHALATVTRERDTARRAVYALRKAQREGQPDRQAAA